jgi:hypothetical protein
LAVLQHGLPSASFTVGIFSPKMEPTLHPHVSLLFFQQALHTGFQGQVEGFVISLERIGR